MSSSTMIVGDLHLGRKHRATYGDPTIWDDDSLEILKGLLRENRPKTLILAGDVFDNSKPSSLVFGELIAVLSTIIRVFIIAGNHDISKIDEPIALNYLGALSNVTLIPYETYDSSYSNGFAFVAWQPTQEHFVKTMEDVMSEVEPGTVIITHCSRLDFGNQMDNICTDSLIGQAKLKSLLIVSGHEHSSSISSNFIHLGSVVAHTIAEVGTRYAWVDGGLIKIRNNPNIILTREEPLEILPDKVYYVKTKAEVTLEDLKFEQKDLTIDIDEDFWKQATERGFSKELLDD